MYSLFRGANAAVLMSNARACDPAAVVDSVIEQFASSFSRREIQVRRSIGPMRTSLLDGDALAQVVANLLSNVEKYAPVGTVEIRMELDRDALVLTVADEGPGIPASAAERVFQPFERIHNHLTEGATGTGLGLAIARELAHRMGGTLRLMPQPSRCGFRTSRPGSSCSKPWILCSMRVLLADDDPLTLDGLQACIGPEGFSTLTARNGQEALALWESHRPDLLCLDIMMPLIDGYEVCRESAPSIQTCPCSFLSAKR
jgi:signal transduction histidine kinase